MLKLLNWFKKNWEEVGTLLLLAFIPLYPKLPLFDVVQTWVYIRLDDFVVALVVVGFLIKFYRKRYFPEPPLTYPILIYWAIGALSSAYSLAFIGPKLLGYFPQLVFLHYLRRIEYMIVFFVAAAATRSLPNVRRYLVVFAITVLVVSLYGLGQRFMRLPAFLTMNEEFAKGVPLYLSPTSRITSTFAGHYDLAIYLAFAVTIFASLFLGLRNIWVRVWLLGTGVLATVVLLMTQSRVSLFVLAAGILMVLWWHNQKRWVVPILVLGLILASRVPGVGERFAKTFRDRPVVYDIRAGIPIGAAKVSQDGQVVIERSESPARENLPIGSGFIRIPWSTSVPIIASFALGELRQSPGYPFGREKPSLGEELHMAWERGSVYLSTSQVMATTSGEVASVSGRFLLDRALLYDISFTTRFQGTWPRAWEAFSRNFLLGSGYSVLSIASDSDYLRALGETGMAGLASFLFILVVFFLFARWSIGPAPPLVQALAIGTSAGLAGLLVTAALIDVFEASKVAYVIWLTLGVTVGALGATSKKRFPLWQATRRLVANPLIFIILLGLLAPVVYQGITKVYFVADDFTWLKWAAQSSLADVAGYFTDAAGFFYRPLTKLYFFLASLVFWFKPEGYHAVNLLLHFGATSLTYLIVRKLAKNNWLAVLTSLYFLILAVHHENVIWISGISSLAGGFFALLSLYLWVVSGKHFWGVVSLLGSLVSVTISLFFYEEMLFVPLILTTYAWIFWPKKGRLLALFVLLIIPLYWFIRMNAQALPPTGSYGINLGLLPLNVAGNLVGYVAMVLFGPASIGVYTTARELLRTFPLLAAVLLIAGVVIIYLVAKHFRRPLVTGLNLFLATFVLLALLPSLGLGNLAERYAYLATSGLSFLFVSFVFWLFGEARKSSQWRGALVAVMLFTLSFVTNYYQLRSLVGQWQAAGKLSDRILYEMRRKYYPLEPNTRFVVANVPTRLGRAWVFPVGLSDGAYLVFRDATFKLDIVGNREDALSIKRRDPERTRAVVIEGEEIKGIYE